MTAQQIISCFCPNYFSDLGLCHRFIKRGVMAAFTCQAGRVGGFEWERSPLSPFTGQKMSAGFVRRSHLHSGGSWRSLPASLCGAVMKEGEGEAGWAPGSVRACVRAAARACVCVWVGRAERSHSALERGVHTSQPQGKILHMKVQKNRSYLYFKTVNANDKPTYFILPSL